MQRIAIQALSQICFAKSLGAHHSHQTATKEPVSLATTRNQYAQTRKPDLATGEQTGGQFVSRHITKS
jgi:hypothetical protein